MSGEKNWVDKIIDKLKNHKVLGVIILAGILLIALGDLFDATGKIPNPINKIRSSRCTTKLDETLAKVDSLQDELRHLALKELQIEDITEFKEKLVIFFASLDIDESCKKEQKLQKAALKKLKEDLLKFNEILLDDWLEDVTLEKNEVNAERKMIEFSRLSYFFCEQSQICEIEELNAIKYTLNELEE
jgi:flagellar basal body rod protein FlgB